MTRTFTEIEQDVLRILLCLPPSDAIAASRRRAWWFNTERSNALAALRTDGVVVRHPDGLVFKEDPTREPVAVASDWVARLLRLGGPLSLTAKELTDRQWVSFAAESLRGLSRYTVGGLCRHGWPVSEPKTPGGPGVPGKAYAVSPDALLDTLKWQLQAREQEAGRLRRELAWAEQSITELTALRQAVLDRAAPEAVAPPTPATAQEPA